MGNADSALVADELDGSAARRIDDGKPGRHRLQHERRAGIHDLRVQEQVRSVEDTGRIALRVRADQLHPIA